LTQALQQVPGSQPDPRDLASQQVLVTQRNLSLPGFLLDRRDQQGRSPPSRLWILDPLALPGHPGPLPGLGPLTDQGLLEGLRDQLILGYHSVH